MRDLVEQTFSVFNVATSATRVPLSTTLNLNSRIDRFKIVAIGTTVFLGDSNVTITNGFALAVNVLYDFPIDQQRQLYELQFPLIEFCKSPKWEIPFVCWDLSHLFVVSAAGSNVTVMAFQAMWI